MFTCWSEDPTGYTVDALRRIASDVKPEVEMGFHLCYGDIEHKHFVEPRDTRLLVELANKLFEEVHQVHRISWIHIPVPKDRKDAGYFAPLKNLHLPPETEIFMGLLHAHDLVGSLDRINAASEALSKDFGVATECGMGRTGQEDSANLLSIAALVSNPHQPSGEIEHRCSIDN